MGSDMKKQNGFTIIELLAVISLLLLAGVIFIMQKRDITLYHEDSARKTSVNAIHHYLEKVHFPAQSSYPEELTPEALPGIAPDLLKDPAGVTFNATGSSLRYEPINCIAGACKGYTLTANLVKEADFTKQNTNK